MLSSATRDPSQNEQVSVSSSSKAPHFEHICITGPFCAAEVPVRNGVMVARSHSRKPAQLQPPANVAYQATRIPHPTSHPARLNWDISHRFVPPARRAPLDTEPIATTRGAC